MTGSEPGSAPSRQLSTATRVPRHAPKPNPQITDEQWEGAKKELTAQAHEALGMMASVRKKYDAAISEFKAANDLSANTTTMLRLAGVYDEAGKPDEALAVIAKVLATPTALSRVLPPAGLRVGTNPVSTGWLVASIRLAA